MQVIIPSAKIVSEDLQNLGRLPAIVYPVNQRPVFDYLYKEYVGSDFRVITFENSKTVEQRLSDYENVDVLKLDKLGDLGTSVYAGIKNQSGEGIINFADTIVEDNINSVDGDALFYSEDIPSETWTFFDDNDGRIIRVVDKKRESTVNDNLEKLFVGVFKLSHLEYLQHCLYEALQEENSEISSFYRAIMKYSEKYPFKVIKTDKWFDIGHADKYFSSQLEVKAREFNHIKIDKDRGILTKTSDNVDKFIGEIKWYLKLPTDLEYVRPRIFSYSTSYNSPYVSMEYYAYHTIHELFLYGDLTKNQWTDIFRRIKFIYSDFQRYTVKDGSKIKAALKDMYLTKTINRFEKLKQNVQFSKFFTDPISVNGKKYKSLNEVTNVLKQVIPDKLYDIDQFNIIHGDLCFANIMIDNNYNFVKVIDPRGKFGDFDIYGDPRYELAKLFHSLDGKYDFIIKDLFNINYDLENAKIDYRINDRVRDVDLYELFVDVFEDEVKGNLQKIELIEALLFLSMIPLHGESIRQQLAMLGTGLDILNRVVDITI